MPSTVNGVDVNKQQTDAQTKHWISGREGRTKEETKIIRRFHVVVIPWVPTEIPVSKSTDMWGEWTGGKIRSRGTISKWIWTWVARPAEKRPRGPICTNQHASNEMGKGSGNEDRLYIDIRAAIGPVGGSIE